MEEMILALVAKQPVVASVLVVIGGLRVVFKPLFSAVQAYVEYTVSPDDDAKLAKFMESKIYKAIVYVLDYTASIKLPEKK